MPSRKNGESAKRERSDESFPAGARVKGEMGSSKLANGSSDSKTVTAPPSRNGTSKTRSVPTDTTFSTTPKVEPEPDSDSSTSSDLPDLPPHKKGPLTYPHNHKDPRSITIFRGPIIHSLSLTQLEIIPYGVILVTDGIIDGIFTGPDFEEYDMEWLSGVDCEEVDLTGGEGEFLVPGFVDTHTHAPQYPNNGLGASLQLLDWLENFTFPQEQKFKDVAYAKGVYERVVQGGLAVGTTTCSYYATTHLDSSVALAEICRQHGQRAFIGKCCMDRNSPSTYIETTEQSIIDTKSFISHFDNLPPPPPRSSWHIDPEPIFPPLIQPILTPRFAISCTPTLMKSLSHLATSHDPPLLIQTHLSENTSEVSHVQNNLFPECKSYTEVYEKYGLLKSGTVLAHCVHLSEEEMEMIKRNGAGVSHCPGSNLQLGSGGARVREMLDRGLKVGLGTDCSGGNTHSILQVLRSASDVSRFHHFSNPTTTPLAIAELFYLATLGGASILNLDHRIGNFQIGKEFDAIRVKPRSPGFWVDNKDGEAVERVFEKWIWTGDDRDVCDVYVRGRRVGGVGE